MIQAQHKSPELIYTSKHENQLFSDHYLIQPRPRIMSDINLESTVSRAFGLDNFSFMPIDKPLGKPFYLVP
jgi:hypothetical protein